ncbi:hypothetical protein [Streptomyces luteogriseus]|uniref:hypothetical protein n=1 Tax=Streptomyces luteogriseus TaxID=68233 RepID=UPI0036A48F09
MVMGLLLAFAVLVAAWWVVGAAADALIGRHVHVPDWWAVRILPGYLPAYAREALARIRTSTPED